jgi:hypothetical protein
MDLDPAMITLPHAAAAHPSAAPACTTRWPPDPGLPLSKLSTDIKVVAPKVP